MLSERVGALEQQAMALGTLGIVYDELTDYPKALEYQERALKINEALNDANGAARCHGIRLRTALAFVSPRWRGLR